MKINLENIGAEIPLPDYHWDDRAVLTYALGVGAGAQDPAAELDLTTENSRDHTLRVIPTFGVLLGSSPGALLGSYPQSRVLHAEQAVTLHRELPITGRVHRRLRLDSIWDKGSDIIASWTTSARDAGSDLLLAEITTTIFIRGAGGIGGERGPKIEWSIPDREPDHVVRDRTRTDQALLYRLSGDRNPLHSDPWAARQSGFDRPILHGLCVFGFAGRALLGTEASRDYRLAGVSARFASPVFPGDVLETRIWEEDGRRLFQTFVEDRLVLDRGESVDRPVLSLVARDSVTGEAHHG